MAKVKKATAISPKECLQQAIVPKEEHPYRIPTNWAWTKLGKLCSDIQYGYTSKAIKNNAFPKMLRITDIQDGSVDWSTVPNCKISNEESEKYLLMPNDILFARIGATTGKSYIIVHAPKAVYASYLIRMRVLKPILPLYVYTFLQSNLYWKQVTELSSGIALPGVNSCKLQTLVFPLPPLPEQQRIVDRIESLFSKLDSAKEILQNALDSFETRKSAILHKAFTGELTAKWRKERAANINNWESVSLIEVCEVNPKRANIKDIPDNTQVSFIPMPAISEVLGEITNPQIKSLGEVMKGYTNFCEGDVLFAKITPCMENGKSAIVGKLLNNIGFGSTEFHVLRCGGKLYNRYLFYMVRDITFRNKAKSIMTGAVGQQRVPKKYLENYTFLKPSYNEQMEIVRILDGIFGKEQQAKEAAEAVLGKIDLMKKAILARAFRGELGTNDPREESAIELLKQCINNE